ncbi:penicillin acylase family protein [soil metagenome]
MRKYQMLFLHFYYLKKFLTGIYGILIALLLSSGALLLLFNGLTKKSFYNENGNIPVKGLVRPVEVQKDEFGVPHIYSANASDMYFTMGYMHAQDRLWQMDLTRRVAEGRLSEILGKDVLEYDKLFRTIGISRLSSKLYDNISPESKIILDNYTKGVNHFIETHSKQLPLEFDILNYKPAEWKPQNSLEVIRMMGWELNLSWYTDIAFSKIVEKFGVEKAKDLFPDYPEDKPFIIKEKTTDTLRSSIPKKISEQIEDPNADKIKNKIQDNYNKLAELGTGFYNSCRNFSDFYGLQGMHVGSNSWIISGKKSETGKPLLANDPHLSLGVPSKWYEIDLHNEENRSDVSGFSLPGTPLIVIGKNNTITWGITNLMNDDCDFYMLKKDSTDNHKYIYNNTSYLLDSVSEKIKIKDVKDEYVFTVFSSKVGPIVSDLEKTKFGSGNSFRTNNTNELLAFRWTGFEMSDEIYSFYKINYAHSFDDLRSALKTYCVPALNFTYADTAGNIGYTAGGKVPIRRNLTNDDLALVPSNGETEWTGFIPSEDLPHEYNPKEEYIVSANNKPQKSYKYFISGLYEPSYRAERIEALLKARNNFTSQEFKLIQNDVNSVQARELMKFLTDAYKDVKVVNNEERKFLELMKSWDYEMKPFSSEATIFSQFEVELYATLYREKLGNDLFKDYIFLKNIPIRNTMKLLKDNRSWLLELNGNDKNNIRDFILRTSFVNAINALKKKFSTDDFSRWEWGNLHSVLMKHPLGSVQALSSVLNIGPFDIGGSGTTVNCSEYSFYDALTKGEYSCYLGPSMRMIVDLADMKNYFTIIPTGQSGQPLHNNYRDQVRMWLNGDYKVISTDPETLKKENVKSMTFLPE